MEGVAVDPVDERCRSGCRSSGLVTGKWTMTCSCDPTTAGYAGGPGGHCDHPKSGEKWLGQGKVCCGR